MKMTSFEFLKDLDITSVAISHILFQNEFFFPSSKEMRDSLRFYAMLLYLLNGFPQGGHPYLSECLITNLNAPINVKPQGGGGGGRPRGI